MLRQCLRPFKTTYDGRKKIEKIHLPAGFDGASHDVALAAERSCGHWRTVSCRRILRRTAWNCGAAAVRGGICGDCRVGFRRRTERGKIVWRCGTRMEKGKAECKNSPTLNDQYVREMLGKVVCNGEYDENVIKDKVKRIDVYEKQLIICYAEKEKYQIYEFE